MTHNPNEYSCISLQITTKCNFLCRHCYMSYGPFRNEVISKDVINKTLSKIGSRSKRILIQGGEPTLFPEIIEYIADLCRQYREETGLPEEVCLQTNGSWAKSKDVALSKMRYFKKIGITELIISGFDSFHKEFYNGIDRLEIEWLVNEYKLFNSVTFYETKESDLKYLGRCSKLKNEKVNSLDCSLNLDENKYYVNVYGDIKICQWGHTCYLGSILDIDIEQVSEYEFVKILNHQGIVGLIDDFNKRFGESVILDEYKNACTLCHSITSVYKNL